LRRAGAVRTDDALAGVRSHLYMLIPWASGTIEAMNSGVRITAWMKEEGWFSQFH